MGELAAGMVGLMMIFVYLGAIVLGIFLALSPLFCWIHLREIRRRQAENAQRMDEHLCAMRRSLEKINDTLQHVCGMLDKK